MRIPRILHKESFPDLSAGCKRTFHESSVADGLFVQFVPLKFRKKVCRVIRLLIFSSMHLLVRTFLSWQELKGNIYRDQALQGIFQAARSLECFIYHSTSDSEATWCFPNVLDYKFCSVFSEFCGHSLKKLQTHVGLSAADSRKLGCLTHLRTRLETLPTFGLSGEDQHCVISAPNSRVSRPTSTGFPSRHWSYRVFFEGSGSRKRSTFAIIENFNSCIPLLRFQGQVL